MIRTTGKCLLALAALLLLGGCWSRRELNELSIAAALGIDVGQQERFRVTVQLVNPSQIAAKGGGASNVSPITTVTEEGRSFFDIIRKMTAKVNRPIYLSHLRVMVFGEELARQGLTPPLDFLSRNHEIRTDFFLIVAKQATAEEMLKVLTPRERVPANKLFSSLRHSERLWAQSTKMTLDELLGDLTSEGKEAVMTGLSLEGSPSEGARPGNVATPETKTVQAYDGIAVFRRDKLIGWLDVRDSKGYRFLKGSVHSTVVVNECEGGVAEVEILHAKSRVKGRLVGGRPRIDVRIEGEGNVGDITCKLDMSKPSAIRQLERLTADEIREVVEGSIRTMQERYSDDIFGFGMAIRRSSPKYWHQVKERWPERFRELPVQVKTDIRIRRIGSINQSVGSRVRG